MLRSAKLKANPICERCSRAPATEVHHRRPLKDWAAGRYIWQNLESTCDPCHSRAHGARARASVDARTGLPVANHWWVEGR